MKIIFDENVPWPLRRYFGGHLVTSVQNEGWAGVENGAIIDLVDDRFDVVWALVWRRANVLTKRKAIPGSGSVGHSAFFTLPSSLRAHARSVDGWVSRADGFFT